MTTVNEFLLQLLSNQNVTFYIPPYQRNYEWEKSQCEVFLEDVLKTTELNINNQYSEHFFGSVVYVKENSAFGQPNTLTLTDGQQRITTTMLFLAALRDVIDDEYLKDEIDNRYLKNSRSMNSNNTYKIKLKQVESDWEAYKNIIISNISSKDVDTHVYQNYNYFKKELEKIKNDNKYDLIKLIEDGVSKFRIVQIELEPKRNAWENPQEIFESMNSLGKPLSFADLVRNYLLLGKTASEQENLYNNYWLSMEKTIPGNISNFIRDFMQLVMCQAYKKAKEHNYKLLYSNFKDIYPNGTNIEVLLKDLQKYAKYYSMIISNDSTTTTGNSSIDGILRDLNSIDVTTLYSFIMKILDCYFDTKLTAQEVFDILKVLFIYVLRRRILRLTQGENLAFPRLIRSIPLLISSTDKKHYMYEMLSGMQYALRFPNDDEVKQYLETGNFYNSDYSKFILRLIEEHLTKSRPVDDKLLQKEHIMPQTLNNDWIKDLGFNYQVIHEQYLNNIGNITLIRHNQELGNEAFSKKKIIYQNNSGMQIAKDNIINIAIWNEQAIIDRRDYLINIILNYILPIEVNMKRANNFANNNVNSSKYSFKAHNLIGKTISYIFDSNITALVVSDNEVEFEGKKWKLSPLVKELQIRRNEVNQSGSYQGCKYWTYDGVRIDECY